MKKGLTIGTIATLTFMSIVGLANVETGFNLFMGTGLEHNIARLVLAAALFSTLIVTRPRPRSARVLLGIIASTILTFAVGQSFSYTLDLFDALAYFIAGLMLTLEAIEPETSMAEDTPVATTA